MNRDLIIENIREGRFLPLTNCWFDEQSLKMIMDELEKLRSERPEFDSNIEQYKQVINCRLTKDYV